MELLDRFARDAAACLFRHGAPTLGAGLLAAISGGIDSSALALVLAPVARKLGVKLSLAWVDHGLRPDPEREQAAVLSLARRLELPLLSRRLPPGPSSEAALRTRRYAALCDMARVAGASHIATGHQQDDQLETLLFRLMRGTGPRGLCGIPECRRLGREIFVLRPLLSSRRTQLECLLTEHGVIGLEDPTNQDLGRARNRMRHVILPDLRRQLGCRLDTTLLALMPVARSYVAEREGRAAAMLQGSCRARAPWRLELDLDAVAKLARDDLEETMRELHRRLRPLAPAPPWTWVERMVDLCAGTTGGCVAGPGAPIAERTTRGLLLIDPDRCGAPTPTVLPSNGEAVRFGSTEWWLDAHHLRGHAKTTKPAGQRVQLDADAFKEPLSIRAPRAGESFWPLGQNQPIDLHDFLKKRHLPRFDRHRLPLVVDRSDTILWAVGVEIAHAARITAHTRRFLRVRADTR